MLCFIRWEIHIIKNGCLRKMVPLATIIPIASIGHLTVERYSFVSVVPLRNDLRTMLSRLHKTNYSLFFTNKNMRNLAMNFHNAYPVSSS